jgi:hypothetical protein
MAVDVLTEIMIERPTADVAAFAGEPDNAPVWYENIEAVEWKTPRPLAVGSRLAFVAHFLGRRLAYTYAIVELVPGKKLVMRTAEGPFPMETTYEWHPEAETVTRMTLRNRGEPSGFSRLMSPLMASAMRRANRKDLARLKAVPDGPPWRRPAVGARQWSEPGSRPMVGGGRESGFIERPALRLSRIIPPGLAAAPDSSRRLLRPTGGPSNFPLAGCDCRSRPCQNRDKCAASSVCYPRHR